jgi:hypothetical protein
MISAEIYGGPHIPTPDKCVFFILPLVEVAMSQNLYFSDAWRSWTGWFTVVPLWRQIGVTSRSV